MQRRIGEASPAPANSAVQLPMTRSLIALLLLILSLSLLTAGRAQAIAWEVCNAPAAQPRPEPRPEPRDCRPLEGRIDPQGRELWLRAVVAAPTDRDGRALYIAGVAASQAWLNGLPLGANGSPGSTATAERPGRYQIAFPIRETAWRPGPNTLVVRLSSFHGGVRLDQPIGALFVGPYPLAPPTPLLAIVFAAAGALLAGAFGFAVIHVLRGTGSSLTLAAMAAVAALQAGVESLRQLIPYAYPLHVWRLGAIWLLAAAFAGLLVAYAGGRFWPAARGRLVAVAGVVIGATATAPGFDLKTGLALLAGAALAAFAAAAGVRREVAGARPTLAYLALFLAVGLLFPRWLVDLSFFLLAAGLLLPLLMAEVIRLGREDRGREAALSRAAARPERLTVASARGVELVPLAEIHAIVGADDYVELRLGSGRRLLHAARLDRLEEDLPDGFARVHRSVIANLAHAEGIRREDGGRWRLILRGGDALPVSRARLSELRDALERGGATA
jgi:DNA-binding LytR/AlgR family response regulator